MKILHAAAEISPLIKTGGLGDVVGGLSAELATRGHEVAVALPWYRRLIQWETPPVRIGSFIAQVGNHRSVGWWYRASLGRVVVYVADGPEWFDRPGVYGEGGNAYPDNLSRFAYFSQAVAQLPQAVGWSPDVVHLHDWHAALVPAYWVEAGAPQARHVLTIHNLAYQGIFPGDQFSATGLPVRFMSSDYFEFWGQVNCLKGGIQLADVVTTVSPSYREEVLTSPAGCGLEGVLATRAGRSAFVGIINGLDIRAWDPANDPDVWAPYDAASWEKKAFNKLAYGRSVGWDLRRGTPLCVMISRLTLQKGCDIATEVTSEALNEGAFVAFLGTGDPVLEHRLSALEKQFPRRVRAHIGFDEALARRLYAAADVFLMPSRFEPCGLSQLIAFRYGAVPVVHATGGLKDTVAPYDPATGRGTGFVCSAPTVESFGAATQTALEMFRRPKLWKPLVRRVMGLDVSWRDRMPAYEELYRAPMTVSAVRGPS